MKKSIEFITALLQVESQRYKQQYDELTEQKKQALADLERNYVKNTPLYAKRLSEITSNYEETLANERANSIANVSKEIEDFKNDLRGQVKIFDKSKLDSLNALRGIPMSSEELLAIADKFSIKSDYWANRSLALICEQNAVDPTSVGCTPTLDVRLNVLTQLEWQYEEILTKYGLADTAERPQINYLYLNDDVCANAKAIFYGGDDSTENMVNRAFMVIKAQPSELSRGVSIGNAMRNLKQQQQKNELMFMLKTSKDVSDYSIEFSGYYDEIHNFDAVAFAEARRSIDRVKQSNDDDAVEQIIKDMEESKNVFFGDMLKAESKKNEGLKQLLADDSKTDNNSHSQTKENVVELKY